MKSRQELEKIAEGILENLERCYNERDRCKCIDELVSALARVQDEALNARLPSDEECAKKALEICLNEPERVTQRFACENVTRAFYDWLRANLDPAPKKDPIAKHIQEILEKSNEIKDQFIKTWVATKVEPGMRDEHIKAILNTMAVYEQRDGLSTKWFLGPRPELKEPAPAMPSEATFRKWCEDYVKANFRTTQEGE